MSAKSFCEVSLSTVLLSIIPLHNLKKLSRFDFGDSGISVLEAPVVEPVSVPVDEWVNAAEFERVGSDDCCGVGGVDFVSCIDRVDLNVLLDDGFFFSSVSGVDPDGVDVDGGVVVADDVGGDVVVCVGIGEMKICNGSSTPGKLAVDVVGVTGLGVVVGLA